MPSGKLLPRDSPEFKKLVAEYPTCSFERMTKEQELIISLLQQLNKSLAEAVKLERFIAGELQKQIRIKEKISNLTT